MIVAAYPEALCSRSVTSRFATMASCASPAASQSLRFVGYLIESLQLKSPTAGQQDLPDVASRILPWMPGPIPRQPLGCFCPFLPPEHRPSPKRHRVGAQQIPCNDFGTGTISELQSFLYVQASKFACHPGRSHRCHFLAGRPWRLLPSTV
jgi:hypothetical protein